MPPTAAEIKARLDKAVDEEGNVLNMDAVHDIVTWLERVNITKEALEATRIGRAMNLMRKKTQNEDLAKRAKNLIKKWKGLVQQHKKNGVLNSNSNDASHSSRPNSRTTNKELLNVKYSTDSPSKTGLKRKRTSGENSPININRTSSPRVSSSPRISSPRVTPSPHSLSINKVASKLSPLVNSSVKSVSSPKISRLVNDSTVRTLPNLLNNRNSPLAVDSKEHNNLNHKTDNLNSSILTKNEIRGAVLDYKKVKDSVTPNHSSIELKKTEHFVTQKSTDTRNQEDRISSFDSGYQGTQSCEENTPSSLPSDLDDKVFKPISPPSQEISANSSSTATVIPENFEPIEPEELSITRKELPPDIIYPDTPADGVNGVFNENNEFREWTDEVVWRDKDYHILPYVILD